MTIAMLIPLIFLSFLAFWRPTALLFMLVAGISLMTGLAWFDTYGTSMGLTIALMLIVYSFASVGYAYKCLLWREG